MFIRKIFYTLEDIKKQITIIPILFTLLITVISLIVSSFIVKKELDQKIELLIQEDKFYKTKVLNSYIADVKYNASAIFDIVEIDLRRSVNELAGFIKASRGESTKNRLKKIEKFVKNSEGLHDIEFVVFDYTTLKIVHGYNIIDYLKTLSNSKLKTKIFEEYILKNIHSLGEENIQYWMDQERRSIRLSYFEKLHDMNLFIGVFSKIDNIKVETKRAIFESILTKSKVIEGHFWFYDYLNNIVFNYYNKSRAFDLEDILKDNQTDTQILNLYQQKPELLSNNLENTYNFTKFDFLVTVKTDGLNKKIDEQEKEYHLKLVKIWVIIIVAAIIIISFLKLFTRFITKIFTRFNRRLQLKTDMFKRWKERYELAIIASNDGFWDINFKDNKIYFSEKWLEMFGYKKDEIVTLEDWFDLIHFEDKNYVKSSLDSHIKGETKNFIAEYRLRNKFNVYKWVLVRGKVFKDSKGRPNRMLMTSMDIDDNKQISKELKDVELLVDVGRIVIFKWRNDEKLTVDYVSKSITSYGYSKEKFEKQVIGYLDFVHQEDVIKLKSEIIKAIEEKESSFSLVYRVLESNGTIKWVYNRTILLKDHMGNITHLYGYINDITQMKMNEQELKMRVEYEAQKNLEKDRLLIHQNKLASMGEMLGSIAHQWRQPLNNISLLIHFIRDNFQNKHFKQEDMNENIAAIKLQIDYMSQTIDDFRNFYQPNKDKNRFNIKTSIESAYKIVQTQFEKENISVSISGDEVEMLSYENEFQQVIVNILNNAKDAAIDRRKAVEFEPEVNITIRHINSKVIIDLSNNCGTLTNKVLARIFEPYFTTKFENQGTGIGLYMSKTIIEKNMNGEIGAKKIENGLNFSIILPI